MLRAKFSSLCARSLGFLHFFAGFTRINFSSTACSSALFSTTWTHCTMRGLSPRSFSSGSGDAKDGSNICHVHHQGQFFQRVILFLLHLASFLPFRESKFVFERPRRITQSMFFILFSSRRHGGLEGLACLPIRAVVFWPVSGDFFKKINLIRNFSLNTSPDALCFFGYSYIMYCVE